MMTIDKLRAVTVRQLSRIHDLGSYRNACRIINQLAPYTHQQRDREKVVYLNKEGRDLIGSTNEVKRGPLMDHILLANEAYIYFNCPLDWRAEVALEAKEQSPKGIIFNMPGIAIKIKKVIADAVFTRNGYVHLIEIDNTRHMQDNIKKIMSYQEIWQDIKKEYQLQPMLYFFTTTADRKNKISRAIQGARGSVVLFDDIR